MTKGCHRIPMLLLVSTLALLGGCQRANRQEAKPTPAAMMESVRLCRPSTLLVPLLVAERETLFAQQGLTVTSTRFTVGRDALEAMFRGECDLAVAAEPPVVEYALKRDDFRIITTVQSSDTLCRLLGRKDRGITQPSDLRGKRIATVKGTAPHYFLQLFLQKYHINSQEARIRFVKSDEVLTALTSGDIDAIAMTDPVITQAEQALGEKAVTFTTPGLYRNYVMVLASSALLAKEPRTGKKFLMALARAAELINQNPEQAQAVVMAEHKLTRTQVAAMWEMNDFRLSLDHPLLLGLEDTARWYLQQTGSNRPLPNFITCIHSELLASVRPDAVNLLQ